MVVQIQPAIPAASHAIPPNKMLGVGVRPTITNMVTVAPPPTPTHSLISAATHHRRTQRSRFGFSRPTKYTVRVAEQSSSSSSSSSLVGDDEIKPQLYQALKGINRGIFGVPSAKKYEIEALVKQLESQNPTPDPILNLEKMGGCWKLVYSTITILGSKRTKLGLREFVSLGDFLQNIDTAKGKAVNVIKFDVKGLNLLNGRLTIEASFNKASNSRVDINYVRSTITPDQLMSVFGKNFDLLLAIFNPDGWLEITYLDDTMRIGRDDKGNIFILERSHDY